MAGIDRALGFTRLLLGGDLYCDVTMPHDEVLAVLGALPPEAFLRFTDVMGDPASFRVREIWGVRGFGPAQAAQVIAIESDGEGWRA